MLRRTDSEPKPGLRAINPPTACHALFCPLIAAGKRFAGGRWHGILPPVSETPDPPAPSEAALHEAALAHLARYATTEAGLLRVLERRIARWRRSASGDAEALAAEEAAARVAVRRIVARLAAAGGVDDAAFARARAERLHRSGRSRRAIAAHLAARGVAAETARAALPEAPESELAAALTLARRRRLGPFRIAPPPAPGRELAMLARAGFSQAIAEQALAMSPEAALALVLRFRRGGV